MGQGGVHLGSSEEVPQVACWQEVETKLAARRGWVTMPNVEKELYPTKCRDYSAL